VIRPAVGVLLLAASMRAALAVTPQDFAFGMRLETVEPAAAYRFELPLEVYRGVVRSDLGDLRVFNARNEVVPYELRRPQSALRAQGAATQLPLFPLRGDPRQALDALRVTIQSGGASLDLKTSGKESARVTTNAYILDARPLTVPISALQLEWPEDAEDFAGRLEIEASDDLAVWHSIARAVPIANLRANGQRLIERRAEFSPTKAKFWRLSWAGTDAPFLLSAVNAEPVRDVIDAHRESLTVDGQPMPDKPGEFTFDFEASLPADRVNVELPERNSVASIAIYSRTDTKEIWRSVARKGLYRLDGAEGELRNAPVPIAIDSDRYWLVRFEQPEVIGRGVPRLSIEWIPHELIFVARGAGPYSLAYGSADAKPAETRIAGVLPRMETAIASPSAPFALGGVTRREPAPTPFPWKTAVLWIALASGVALLGWMAYRLSRQLNAPR
jgi:Protein of unknown function (DUF3999)